MSILKKYFTPIASTIGFLALSNLISVDAAGAVRHRARPGRGRA